MVFSKKNSKIFTETTAVDTQYIYSVLNLFGHLGNGKNARGCVILIHTNSWLGPKYVLLMFLKSVGISKKVNKS